MSEFNHEMFPCDMPANTQAYDKGYMGIKWDTPHDENGYPVKTDKKDKEADSDDER